jgi:signal transduction histidine kinase
MAKKKSISISLAAKCQLLFGLAVLVIIAGALAVPWQRMEQLAGQPNEKAARYAADVFFRQIHAAPTTLPASATQPAPARWNSVQLVPGDFPPPRVYTLRSLGNDWSHLDGDQAAAAQAIRFFASHIQEPETGSVISGQTVSGEKSLYYRYFAAIRTEASCIKCHADYAELAKNPATPALGEGLSFTDTGKRDLSTMPETLPAASHADLAAWPVVGVIRVDVPYQTDENQLLLNRIVIVVAGMVGGTLAIVVFYLITSRLILQPVRVLKNTAEKVAAGDLKIRSAISTGDEFQHLSETFNTMLTTLQGSQDQLEATNRSLDTRVGELAQSNVDLFEANRIKSEFLTNVTHELRTPLNAIIGFADLTADTARSGGDAKQQRYAENIRTSAKQLLDLINDLLDLAKIEAGKLVLREEKLNVADVCEAMANFMRPLAQKKNIDIVLAIATDMPLISTDPGRFQQILYNFLSNAIKFTPPDGRISIAARNESPDALSGETTDAASPLVGGGNAIRVDISDTGPGISPEDQKVIFEKFRQIDGSVTRQHSGTGLGLAISRELAHMLGARIELSSIPGRGATFSLIIPQVNPQRTVDVHSSLENI